MIYVAMCDDEKRVLVKYKQIFEEIRKVNEIDIKVYFFQSAEELLSKNEKVTKLDIIYMDNYMTGMKGLEAAELVRKENKQVQIIFFSNSSDFVFDAYRVKANCYLLKDEISDDDFKESFLSVYNEVLKEKSSSFVCKQENKNILIPFYEIIAFEVILRKLHIYTKMATFTCYDSINEVYRNLNRNDFIMINRSCIINFNHVEQLSNKEIKMQNGESYQISIRREKEVKKALLKFLETLK